MLQMRPTACAVAVFFRRFAAVTSHHAVAARGFSLVVEGLEGRPMNYAYSTSGTVEILHRAWG